MHHAENLIRAFASFHGNVLQYQIILFAGSEGPDQTAHSQSSPGLRCPHMPEGTFSHDAVHLCSVPFLSDARCMYKYIFKFSKAFAD